MVEKLKLHQVFDNNGKVYAAAEPDNTELREKINELIDVVNELQAQVAILEEHAHPTATTEPVDKFAKQKRWIGKLCWFWDNNSYEKGTMAILDTIDESNETGYYFQTGKGSYWQHCEPVLPYDDGIYKGE